jgi:hypothetical protein
MVRNFGVFRETTAFLLWYNGELILFLMILERAWQSSYGWCRSLVITVGKWSNMYSTNYSSGHTTRVEQWARQCCTPMGVADSAVLWMKYLYDRIYFVALLLWACGILSELSRKSNFFYYYQCDICVHYIYIYICMYIYLYISVHAFRGQNSMLLYIFETVYYCLLLFILWSINI